MLADQIAIAMVSGHLFFTALLPQKMGVEKDKKEGLEWLSGMEAAALSENERDDA